MVRSSPTRTVCLSQATRRSSVTSQPDLLAGLTNSFSFAGFDLSFLIDARFGGKMFSGTNHALQAGGAAAATVVNGARDKFVVDGAVESEVAGKTVYTKNTIEVTPQDYWGAIVGRSGNSVSTRRTSTTLRAYVCVTSPSAIRSPRAC